MQIIIFNIKTNLLLEMIGLASFFVCQLSAHFVENTRKWSKFDSVAGPAYRIFKQEERHGVMVDCDEY